MGHQRWSSFSGARIPLRLSRRCSMPRPRTSSERSSRGSSAKSRLTIWETWMRKRLLRRSWCRWFLPTSMVQQQEPLRLGILFYQLAQEFPFFWLETTSTTTTIPTTTSVSWKQQNEWSNKNDVTCCMMKISEVRCQFNIPLGSPRLILVHGRLPQMLKRLLLFKI